MTSPVLRLLLVIAVLYALGAFTLLIAPWTKRWPILHDSLGRLGKAACDFALGFMGLVLVVIVLRSAGCFPS